MEWLLEECGFTYYGRHDELLVKKLMHFLLGCKRVSDYFLLKLWLTRLTNLLLLLFLCELDFYLYYVKIC